LIIRPSGAVNLRRKETTMKSSEIKDIAIKELFKGIESAYYGLAEHEEMTIEEIEKANKIIYEAQQLLIKKYM